MARTWEELDSRLRDLAGQLLEAEEQVLFEKQQAVDELYDKNELAAAQAAKAVADARDLERDTQMIYDSLRSPASLGVGFREMAEHVRRPLR